MAQMGFWDRLKLAWRILNEPQFADKVVEAVDRPAMPPERVHASALTLLAAFQREGRLVDFLQQEVAGFSDEDIGAAARVVHGGCRKAFHQFFRSEERRVGKECRTR